MSYSIIIPIYNEEKTLPELLKGLRSLNKNYQIIIIDDGSEDETKKILENISEFKVVFFKENIGKGNAIKTGLNYAINDNIILFDGDLEIGIENINLVIKEFEKLENDVITGIRWIKNNDKINIHKIGNVIINAIFNFIYKTKYNDVLCCLRIMKTNLFKSLNIESNGFNIEVETLAKITKRKLAVKELPIRYTRRTVKQGKKIRMIDSIKIIKTILINR